MSDNEQNRRVDSPLIHLEGKKALAVNNAIKEAKGTLVPNWARPSKTNQQYRKTNRVLNTDNEIVWDLTETSELPIFDSFELTSSDSTYVISFAVDKTRCLKINICSSYPYLRLRDEGEGAYYTYNYTSLKNDVLLNVKNTHNQDASELIEYVTKIIIKGSITFYCETDDDDIQIVHTFNSLPDYPGLSEKITIINDSMQERQCSILSKKFNSPMSLDKNKNGASYVSVAQLCKNRVFIGSQDTVSTLDIPAKDSAFEYMLYTSYHASPELMNMDAMIKDRSRIISSVFDLRCMRISIEDDQRREPNSTKSYSERKLEAMFSHALLRMKDSLMKLPSNSNYLFSEGGDKVGDVSVDQAFDYAAPFFGYSNDSRVDTQMDIAVKLFLPFIRLYDTNKKKMPALPFSVSAFSKQGWSLNGDLGNTQMFGLGYIKYILLKGDENYARQMFRHFVKPCVEYVLNKRDKNRLIRSDGDLYADRFSSSKYNLMTNVNSYELLTLATNLSRELDYQLDLKKYELATSELKDAIIDNFSVKLCGKDTFAAYKRCSKLRPMGYLPINAGIEHNAQSTIKLFCNKKLYKNGSINMQKGFIDTYDAVTINAIKATFIAGDAEQGLKMLTEFTDSRIVGNHAPYCYESFPNGGRLQKAGESALYLRLFIEGILGLRVVGLQRFFINPHIPASWKKFKMFNVRVCGKLLDIFIENNELLITCVGKDICHGTLGSTFEIDYKKLVI